MFIHGVAAWGEGVGEQLTPALPPEQWYLVLVPETELSTRKIFSHPDLTRNSPKRKMRTAFEGSDRPRNDCEPVVRRLYPAVDQALEWLEQYGEARLTGTGGCIFVPLRQNSQPSTHTRRNPQASTVSSPRAETGRHCTRNWVNWIDAGKTIRWGVAKW